LIVYEGPFSKKGVEEGLHEKVEEEQR